MTSRANTVDPTRYPLTAAYLASLPAGLESYPECLVKSDVHTNLRESYPALAKDDSLPPILLSYLRDTYKEAWYPDVAGSALLMLLRDTVFASDDAAVDWVDKNMDRIYSKPLYRMLMFVFSPTLIVMGATKRWEAFHRGSTLAASPVQKKAGRVMTEGSLTYPPHLFNQMHLRQFGAGYRSALRGTRGRDPQVVFESLGPSEAHFVASWQE